MTKISDDIVRQFSNALDWLEKQYGLPPGFMLRLSPEDDWSFIIKAHALIEAAVSNQLTKSLEPRLSPVFEQLELSDPRKGKLAFAKALDLLDEGQRRYVRLMSELRNQLVHNIRSVTFDLRSYVADLDPNQRKSFLSAITYFSPDNEAWKAKAAEDPKYTIDNALFIFLIQTTTSASGEEARRELQATKAKLLDDFLGKSPAI